MPKVAVKWKDIGIQLLDHKYWGALDIIEADCKLDSKEGCKRMFKKWLEIDTGASWDKLLKAIKSPAVGLLVIAKEIEKEIGKGTFSNYSHILTK